MSQTDLKHLGPTSAESPVIAWLSARDFMRAREFVGFSMWADRREFRDERDALFYGYGCAGVTAFRQLVPFHAFVRWTRIRGAPCDIVGLDEFAAHWRWRLSHPGAQIVGHIRATWEEVRNVSVQKVQNVSICPEMFQQWSSELVRLDLFSAPNIDDYAKHAIAVCVDSRV